MNNTLRKISTFALAIATIVSVSGIASVNTVKAAAPDMSLIKMNGLSTVYYLKDAKRYVFPNEKTFLTWYRNFSSVMTISQSELESYPLGGNVTYRPGVQLVKITTDPKVYAVGYNRTLHSIVSEQNAINLWGSNWASMVQDVPDSFFTNYVVGAPLTEGMYGEGQLVKMSNSPDVYYYDGSNYRAFSSEAAFSANRFSFAHVATAPVAMSLTPVGSMITGVDNSLINTAGSASSSVSTGTGLSVALSADTPASASLPLGATGVTYTKFNVTASNDGDIVLQSVTVHRSGVGTPSDFENVYLYDGMTRLTTGRSINTSTNQATFNNLNLTIARGTTKTLMIVADMLSSGTGSGSSSLGIEAASGIAAGGATVTGSFPVMGNMMGMTNVTAGTITIEKTGSLTNPKAGETGAKIASFRLTAGSSEDIKVTGITLYNSGSVQSDRLTNFMLKQGGSTVATAAAMANNNIMLTFSAPFMLEKGASRTFELYGDVAASARSGDTIVIYLDNSADLHSVGQTYGFGASVDRTAYDGGSDSSSTSIEAGQVTLSFQGPSVTDLAVQQQDVELFRFTITSQSNIEIRNTHLNLTTTSSSADNDLTDVDGLLNLTVPNYTDIKFTDVNSNQLVAGPKDVTASGNDLTQTLNYSDIWNVNAGQTRTIKVTTDIANFTPISDETIKATLNVFTDTDIKNLDTNQFLDVSEAVVPSTNIAGNTHPVKSGSVTVSLAGTPSAQTYINGATGIQMTGMNVAAGTGKDIKITSVMFTAVGANSCATETDCVLNVKLWDGATQVGQTKSLSTDTVTFNNLNVMVPKGTTKTLIATVDLNTLSSVAGSTTLRLNIAAATDVVAQDVDGNSISVSGTVTGPNHTVSGAGSLSVVAGSVTAETEARIILTGKTDEVLASYRFTAANEALKLTKVRIEVPASALEEVNSVSLWDGATKVTGDVTLTSGTPNYADFNSFTSDFVIPKDSSKTLTVKGNTGTISGGATSGTDVTATLSSTNFEARGTNSNTVLSGTDLTGDPITGQTMVLRKTKLTLAEGAAPACSDSGCLTNGASTKLHSFTATADANEDAAIKQMIFDITLTDNVGTNDTLTMGSFRLFRNGSDISSQVDIHNLAGATIESTNTLGEGTSQAIVTFTDQDLVAKGTTNTYELWATPGGYTSTIDNDAVKAVLNTDATAQTAGLTYLIDLDTTASEKTASLGNLLNTSRLGTEGASATLATNAMFLWSDNSAVPHTASLVDSTASGDDSTSSGDWFNSYLFKTTPFTGWVRNN